jgi:hypothetical protein
MGERGRKPSETILLACAFLAAGLAGIFAGWASLARPPNTSPLMALFALVWGCTWIVTAVLSLGARLA